MKYSTRSYKTTVVYRATAKPVECNDTSEHMQTHNAIAQRIQDDTCYTAPTPSIKYYTRSYKTTVGYRATVKPVECNDTSEHMQTHNAVAQKIILLR
jgi:hypothetical protein